jgi:lysophospholipase L1-like esterase
MINRSKYFLSMCVVLIFTLFLGCSQTSILGKNTKATILKGYAVSLVPMGNADITIYDKFGKIVKTKTNEKGEYSVSIEGLEAPLLVNSVENGFPNISDNSKPRGKSVAALVSAIQTEKINIANLNPITDKVVSDVAEALSLKGPVELILNGKTEGITPEVIKEKTDKNLILIKQALYDAGVKSPDTYDPVTTPMDKSLFEVFGLIRHNRSYHTSSGKVSGTLLFDITFHPLSPADVLDYKKASEDKKKLENKNVTRVFIAGDSTGSNYESELAPRKGWGQVFQKSFKDNSNVMVVNAAMSGRSSRSYINEGWLRMYEELIKPGDYLFIQFGHNDEKCGGSIPAKERDIFDLTNTGTYPNDRLGNVQGEDNMSFQRWLEKYVNLAISKNATPVLLTSITRIVCDADKKTGVFPIESSTHIVYREKSTAKYVGNYAQTTRDTAKANNVDLIDIEKESIKFANSVGEPGWKQYWLAVDPAEYPYYVEGKTGNINKPDATHLQEKGALKISSLVAEGIKEQSALSDLAKLLK